MPTPDDSPRTITPSAASADSGTVVHRAPTHHLDAGFGLPSVPGYTLAAEIARGGMGVVYAAHDPVFVRDVAVKVMHPGQDAGRFVVEARVTARLPHPGVPPVYALGTLADDGRPFLAMKRIDGRTLADELRAVDRAADLPRLLGVFESICQTVGFAHSRGVIHRDLKPANVMVGAFGEVQVMDWGLAKDLASRARDGTASEPGNPCQHGHGSPGTGVPRVTLDGQILGTPAYMAPEQARGEDVDARADVFALGCLLFEILTGGQVYGAGAVNVVVARAMSARLDDALTRLAQCPADADLVALCRRCLHADRADRPADGRAVAEAVSAYRASVAERVRRAEVAAAAERARRRVLVVSAAAAVAVLAAGVGVSVWQAVRATDAEGKARAEEQKTAAALHRATEQERATAAALERVRAEQATTSAALATLTDAVVETRFARQAALGATERAFLRRVVALYEQGGRDPSGTPTGRMQWANVRHRIGQIHLRLGDLAAAEADLRAARVELMALTAESPDDPEFRAQLAQARATFASLLQTTDRLGPAEEEYAAARELYLRLTAVYPKSVEFRVRLAMTRCNLGLILKATNRPSEAEVEYTAARDLLVPPAAGPDPDGVARRQLVTVRSNLAILYRSTGRPKEAEAEYAAAAEVAARLAAEVPDVPEHRNQLAIIHMNRAVLLAKTGRRAAAAAAFAASRDIRQALVTEFPAVPDYQNALAGTLMNMAMLAAQDGKYDDARRLLDEATPFHRAALRANPKDWDYRVTYRNNRALLAKELLRAGEHAAGAAVAAEILDYAINPGLDAYEAAQLTAVADQIVRVPKIDPRLSEAQAAELSRRYADRAIGYLRRAADAGYRNPALMRSDGAFAGIRDHPEFQRLLAELSPAVAPPPRPARR